MAERRSRGWVLVGCCVAVGVAASVVSVWRLLLTDGHALSNLVWAEDGLFPLCVRAHDAAQCAIEPYSGYLLLLPRLVAWPVSLAPIDTWPLATNGAAAILAGVAAAALVAIARAAGRGWACSVVIAMLPVLAPIMGVEAINATASGYMLLPFVACVAACLPPIRRVPTVVFAAGAFTAAVTLPSAVVLLLPLAVHTWRGRFTRRSCVVVGASLIAGLVVQTVAIVTAAGSRGLGLTASAAWAFVETLPGAVMTNWPAHQVRLVEGGAFAQIGWMPAGAAGLLLIAVVLALGTWLVARSGYVSNAVGLLLVCGLCFGSIPVVFGVPNNRYFVLPVLLWTAAAVVSLDRLAPVRWREWAVAAFGVVALLLWLPHLPALPSRAVADPAWNSMLATARFTCASNPAGAVAFTFTPRWPDPASALSGRTTNSIPCAAIDDIFGGVGD